MPFSSMLFRGVAMALIATSFLSAASTSARAQTMRQQMADKLAADAGHMLVNKINGENCTQFASTMSQMKNSKSNSSSTSSRLKANPQAREEFVNIVAGPLMNKMIDCNMLPGGM